MSLKEKIQKDIKEALHNREELKISVLRMVSSILHNKEIDKKEELSEEEINKIIFSEIKKRKESIAQFEKADRKDLVDKEKKELEILKKYAPEQMSEEETRKIVEEVVSELGAENMKDMGNVMKETMKKVQGKADGSLVNKIVRELLS